MIAWYRGIGAAAHDDDGPGSLFCNSSRDRGTQGQRGTEAQGRRDICRYSGGVTIPAGVLRGAETRTKPFSDRVLLRFIGTNASVKDVGLELERDLAGWVAPPSPFCLFLSLSPHACFIRALTRTSSVLRGTDCAALMRSVSVPRSR
jgi:hypothetical protein